MQVKFNENNIAYVVFHKWDYGQELSFDSVPDNSEVHFPVRDSDDAVKVKVVNNKCSIPNSTLTLDLSSFDAWLYVDYGEQGRTKKTIHFTLNQRPKPEGHIYNFEEDKILDFNNKLDKFQGAENTGKTFIVDDEGNARIGDMPKFAVDCKLSETSNNPIANSAVAKVLSGGRLVGIEMVYDYESFMDFYVKFVDFESGELLIAEDEYFVVLAIDDIYDESGEYNDTSTILEGGIYIWGGSFDFTIGTVTESDLSRELSPLREAVNRNNASIQSISREIKTLPTNETLEQLQNVITLPEKHIKDAAHILRAPGVYIVDCETTEIVIGSTKKHLITMSKGEIIMVSLNYIEGTPVRPAVAFTKQGIKHFPNLNADDFENLRCLTNKETEKLVDDKLAEFEQSSIPQITVNETTAAIQPNVYYCFGEVESLSIEFGPEKADCVNEYMFEFISGSTPTNLMLPADIKWATEIDVSANKKYQVSIVNNVGLMAGVDV
ncbi:MAG: hypothetical protein K2L19_03180 [Eubacterium sp.]|nr:hypothetical protein [Eubacterium sp.]